MTTVTFTIEITVDIGRELDGRWVAAVANLPGVTARGRTRLEALVALVTRLEQRVPLPS